MIDADPQGSLTASLGYVEPDDINRTLATVMMEVMNDVDINPMDGILHHSEGVDVLPANIELSGLEVALVNVMSREVILKLYIEMIREQYDVVLVDCMPSLGMMTINALAAADEVIIPCSASYLPVKGLEQLMATIVKVKKHLNRKLRICGIVMTMTDFRTNYAKDIAEMIRSGYGSKVGIFKTTIPFSVKAAEPSAEGVSVYKHCPGGKVANAFLDLTKVVEVIRYFASSTEVTSLYKVKLMKLMWYADALSYKRRGFAITGLVYQALPMGAVPVGHNSIIDLKDVPCEEVDMGETNASHFSLSGKQAFSELSDEEKDILDVVIEKLGKMSKNEIINFMHKEQAYVETAPRDIIQFKYAESLQI